MLGSLFSDSLLVRPFESITLEVIEGNHTCSSKSKNEGKFGITREFYKENGREGRAMERLHERNSYEVDQTKEKKRMKKKKSL